MAQPLYSLRERPAHSMSQRQPRVAGPKHSMKRRKERTCTRGHVLTAQMLVPSRNSPHATVCKLCRAWAARYYRQALKEQWSRSSCIDCQRIITARDYEQPGTILPPSECCTWCGRRYDGGLYVTDALRAALEAMASKEDLTMREPVR